MSVVVSKGPELLDDLEARLAFLLERHGLTKERTDAVARKITGEMALAWGGQNIYFPVGKGREIKERDSKIFADFTGHNHAELAVKYQLTVPYIYRVIKRCKDK